MTEVNFDLSFAKILFSREINSLHTFLSPPICYDCSPCSPSFELWFGLLARCFRSHRTLLLENLALQQQLAVLKRRHPRARLHPMDKLFWVLARRFWADWKKSLLVVTPESVVRWHRAAFPAGHGLRKIGARALCRSKNLLRTRPRPRQHSKSA